MSNTIYDPNFLQTDKVSEDAVDWYEVSFDTFDIYGLDCENNGILARRIPDKIAETVNRGVRGQNGYCAGGRIRFSTDSEFKYKIITEKYLDMLKERFKDFLGFDININVILVKPENDYSEIYSQMIAQMPKQEDDSKKAKAERPVRNIVPPNYNFEPIPL